MTDGAAAGPTLRAAAEADVPAIAAIYRTEVLEASASWELEPPDVPTMLERYRASVGHGYPYLVATIASRVVGYAYASAYRPRAGYRYTVEDSVYVAPDARGRGVGSALLAALVDECARRGFRQMVAVIGGADQTGSIRAHAALGFVEVGRLSAIGRKFDRWHDSVLMQRGLAEGSAAPPR